MRTLIVEDEPGIFNFLKQGLEEESYPVTSQFVLAAIVCSCSLGNYFKSDHSNYFNDFLGRCFPILIGDAPICSDCHQIHRDEEPLYPPRLFQYRESKYVLDALSRRAMNCRVR